MKWLFLLLTVFQFSHADTTEQEATDSSRALFGSIVATVPGLGLGHLVQGRYLDKGWLFTVGETAGLAGAVAALNIKCGSVNKNSCGAARAIVALVSLGSYFGLHIWESVDAWSWDPKETVTLIPLVTDKEASLALRLPF